MTKKKATLKQILDAVKNPAHEVRVAAYLFAGLDFDDQAEFFNLVAQGLQLGDGTRVRIVTKDQAGYVAKSRGLSRAACEYLAAAGWECHQVLKAAVNPAVLSIAAADKAAGQLRRSQFEAAQGGGK